MRVTSYALVAATLLLMAFVTRSHVLPPPASPQEVQQALTRIDPDLKRVVALPIPGRNHTFVAICDTSPQWWGDFRCVRFKRGKLLWTASIEGETPTEQSIDSVRPLRLTGFANPFIEVFGTTHMGHGNCYLYELRGRTLRCVLKTFALDCHEDLNLIRGGRLNVAYKDLNGDGHDDVTFTGIIDEFDDDPRKAVPIRSTPCRKVFLWRPADNCFVPDSARRAGWAAYLDRE